MPSPPLQPEYVAYVTMLGTVPDELRERVLSQFPGPGFEAEWQMNMTVYSRGPIVLWSKCIPALS
jgi:hypothetical protein